MDQKAKIMHANVASCTCNRARVIMSMLSHQDGEYMSCRGAERNPRVRTEDPHTGAVGEAEIPVTQHE